MTAPTGSGGVVAVMTDAALLAEHSSVKAGDRGTYKQKRRRADRAVAVRDELERRGLVEPMAAVLARAARTGAQS